MKILVIDDDPDVAEVVSIAFELRWPDVMIMTSPAGTRGIEMVRTESPDVVVLDIGLPDIDGLQVCREIRRFSEVPILMLTVRSTPNDIAQGFEAGANDYVTKPFNPVELVDRVEQVLPRSD